MKTIINGRLYNTDTATLVGEHSNGYFPNDFNYMEEYLYQKTSGEFFIFGKGCPMTRYAERVGTARTFGIEIRPLTITEVKFWVEEHLSVNTYIELFGEPEE